MMMMQYVSIAMLCLVSLVTIMNKHESSLIMCLIKSCLAFRLILVVFLKLFTVVPL